MNIDLRDYCAFKILPAVYAEYFAGIARGEYPCQEKWEDGIAIESYRIADAMLKAREPKQRTCTEQGCCYQGKPRVDSCECYKEK